MPPLCRPRLREAGLPHVDTADLNLARLRRATVPLGKVDVDQRQLIMKLAVDRRVARAHLDDREDAGLVVNDLDLTIWHHVRRADGCRRGGPLRPNRHGFQFAVGGGHDSRAGEEAPFPQEVGDLALAVDHDGHGRHGGDRVERCGVDLTRNEPCAKTPTEVRRISSDAPRQIVAARQGLPVGGQQGDEDGRATRGLDDADLADGACERGDSDRAHGVIRRLVGDRDGVRTGVDGDQTVDAITEVRHNQDVVCHRRRRAEHRGVSDGDLKNPLCHV